MLFLVNQVTNNENHAIINPLITYWSERHLRGGGEGDELVCHQEYFA